MDFIRVCKNVLIAFIDEMFVLNHQSRLTVYQFGRRLIDENIHYRDHSISFTRGQNINVEEH